MFRLLRYYSIASAIALAVIGLATTLFYRDNAIDDMVGMVESRNAALARSFANTLWPQFSPYLTAVPTQDGDELRNLPQTKEIDLALRSLVAGLPVLKVKIYTPKGLTVYSSERAQIGEDKSKNPAFLAAAHDKTVSSKLSYRDTFMAFEGTIASRDMVESYLPIEDSAGEVKAVFELYSDVSEPLTKIDQTVTRLIAGEAIGFGILYILLLFVVRHADQVIKRQYAALEHENLERRTVEVSLRESEERAEAANKAKSELLANMSHELRTPLNAIIGFSHTIKGQVFGPVENPKYVEYAGDILHSGEHLLDLINDILDVSAVESGKLELYEENVNVTKAVEVSLRLLRPRAEKSGVKLIKVIPDDLPPLWADERRVKQILINLVSNGVKFTQSGGQVTVEVARSEDQGITLSVTDTGVGMTPNELSKAMTSFGQADSGLNRKHEGSGLGLPLAKSLADLHGSQFNIESTKGVCTSVSVTFPPERIASPS